MSVGKRIRARRDALGLTQTQLALRVGIDKGTVWRYETDRSPPHTNHLIKLSDVLGVSVDWLLRGARETG